ncbi:MAG: hypothetical protein LBS97_00535 [Treponema sp.]|nr:hypothetical protein [Treponema sp.]
MAVSSRRFLFQYQMGHSILHKMPAIFKLLLLILLSIGIFFLPWKAALECVPLVCLGTRLCGFSFREQRRDLRPVVFYGEFLYLSALLSNWLKVSGTDFAGITGWASLLSAVLIPTPASLTAFAHLWTLTQVSSLFFRTTSPIALRHGIAAVAPFKGIAEAIALFFGFIPGVFECWNRLELAWAARGGKNGLRKIAVLTPLLVSRGFYEASQKAQAMEARS